MNSSKSITQVIDLVEAIRTSKINLFCERIVEVTHRDWIVIPASWKIGGVFHNMKSNQNKNNESACHDENEEIPAQQNKEDDGMDQVLMRSCFVAVTRMLQSHMLWSRCEPLCKMQPELPTSRLLLGTQSATVFLSVRAWYWVLIYDGDIQC